MSMCRVFSCGVGRGCLLWPVGSLGRTLLAFVLLHSVLQGQICLLLQVFLDFLLLHSSPLCWKGYLFWVLVLEGLVGLHRTIQFSFFSITGLIVKCLIVIFSIYLAVQLWMSHLTSLWLHFLICKQSNNSTFLSSWCWIKWVSKCKAYRIVPDTWRTFKKNVRIRASSSTGISYLIDISDFLYNLYQKLKYFF